MYNIWTASVTIKQPTNQKPKQQNKQSKQQQKLYQVDPILQMRFSINIVLRSYFSEALT